MEETWKVFPLDDRYSVSTLGRVRGVRQHLLKFQLDKDGYQIFNSYAQQKWLRYRVHRVVIQTFVGDIPEGMQVNHINGIKHDNRVVNLEVVTPGANTLHGFRVLGRKPVRTNKSHGESHFRAKLTNEKVIEIRRLYAEGVRQATIAKDFALSYSTIHGVVHRVIWRHV